MGLKDKYEKSSTTLLPLPSTPSKVELKRMYPLFPRKTIRRYVNEILREQGKSVYVNVIDRTVFEQLIEQIGYPVGYTTEFLM
ncbi:hypothetical protein [Dokdonia sp.]|uniref:hypothetical protein n=1 Tax=Dokdonia sp. TaxID=2024995 RepID=UPI003266C860